MEEELAPIILRRAALLTAGMGNGLSTEAQFWRSVSSGNVRKVQEQLAASAAQPPAARAACLEWRQPRDGTTPLLNATARCCADGGGDAIMQLLLEVRR